METAATNELTALPRSPSLPTFFDNLDSFTEAPEGVRNLLHSLLGEEYFIYVPLIDLRGPDVTAAEIRAMVPFIRQIRLKEGLNEAGKTYIALDVSGNPNRDERLIRFLQNRLPQREVVRSTSADGGGYSE